MNQIWVRLPCGGASVYCDYTLEETEDVYIIAGTSLTQKKPVIGTFPKKLVCLEEWPLGSEEEK